jgi:hypothetical protein
VTLERFSEIIRNSQKSGLNLNGGGA